MLDDMVDRIRTLLEARELSTTQFADTIEVSRPVISHILSGRNKPSLEVVQKILAAFPNLAMAWLLNGTEPMLTDADPATATPAARPPLVPTLLPAEAAAPPLAEAPETTSRQITAPATAPAVAPVVAPVATPPAQPFRAAVTTSPDAAPTAPNRPAVAPVRPPVRRFSRQQVKDAPAIWEALEPPATPAVPVAQPAEATSPTETAPAVGSLASPLQPASPVASVPTSPVSAADPVVSPFAVPGKTIRRIVIFYHDGSFADFKPE